MSEEHIPEDPGVRTRAVLLAVAVIFGTLAFGAGAVWTLFPDVREEARPIAQAFPAPTLEIHPVAAYAAYAAAERARLDGAGGRLPIEEAMARVAARGALAYAPLIAPAEAGR